MDANPASLRNRRFAILASAPFAIGKVGVAVLFGILEHQASRRQWLHV